MENFLQQLINGLTLGAIYGLIAIGYTMVYGIIGMINFAHGDLFMLSSFFCLILYLLIDSLVGAGMGSAGLAAGGFVVVMVVAMALTGLWAAVIERVAYRRLRGAFRLAPFISAIGMSLVLFNFVYTLQGPRNKAAPSLLSDTIQLTHGGAFDVTVSHKQILIVTVTAALLAIFGFVIARTSLGRAQRACEQDARMAALLGVDVNRTIAVTFVIGAALAAVAGGMYVINYGVVHYADGFIPGVKAFTAAVLGGIGSLPGAVLGGLLIGLIETFWSAYFSAEYKDVAAFSILAVTLIFMPTGLLGKPEVEKV